LTQYALPISDNGLDTDWVQGAGDGDADHFDEQDEGFGAGRGSGSGPDDATTYWNMTGIGTAYAGDHLANNLGGITDPGVGTGHIYRVRCAKSASAGKQVDVRISLTATGMSSVILDFTNISNVWTTREDTLTAAEADSITDYTSGMVIGQEGVTVGGGAGRTLFSSALEFECPDAGTPEQKNWIRTGHVPNMFGVRPGTTFGRSW